MSAKCDPNADPQTRASLIVRRLKKHYPHATTALNWSNPLELLVATILSAQCTDVRVHQITPALFKTYPTAADYANAQPHRLEQHIRSAGFFRQKTKSIIGAARCLVERFDGTVPSTMAELTCLPGVARKTANVILAAAFDKNEGIAVDTHGGRLATRLALAPSAQGPKDAKRIEQDLMAIIPRKDWGFFSHAMILHGRETCHARNPDHRACILLSVCPTGQDALGHVHKTS